MTMLDVDLFQVTIPGTSGDSGTTEQTAKATSAS
jgi:hypothetical protein